jgi:hypothetical protein
LGVWRLQDSQSGTAVEGVYSIYERPTDEIGVTLVLAHTNVEFAVAAKMECQGG